MALKYFRCLSELFNVVINNFDSNLAFCFIALTVFFTNSRAVAVFYVITINDRNLSGETGFKITQI